MYRKPIDFQSAFLDFGELICFVFLVMHGMFNLHLMYVSFRLVSIDWHISWRVNSFFLPYNVLILHVILTTGTRLPNPSPHGTKLAVGLDIIYLIQFIISLGLCDWINDIVKMTKYWLHFWYKTPFVLVWDPFFVISHITFFIPSKNT